MVEREFRRDGHSTVAGEGAAKTVQRSRAVFPKTHDGQLPHFQSGGEQREEREEREQREKREERGERERGEMVKGVLEERLHEPGNKIEFVNNEVVCVRKNTFVIATEC